MQARFARVATAAGLAPSLGARKVVRKAILEPDNNQIYAAYTLIPREPPHKRSWEDEMTRSIAWDKVTHADVLRAIQKYDRLGSERFFAAHGFAPTTTYDLVWDKRRYPPKAILGTAYEFATGKRLASGDFEGGKTGAVKVLGKLGFTIQPRRPAT
jgi:hypothetical protein